MSRKFAVVFEAASDLQTATELADRILIETVDWLDEHLIEHQRFWLSKSIDGTPLSWKNFKKLAQNAGIRVQGHFDGVPAAPDAHIARRAIHFLRHEFPDLAGVLLIRDQDDQIDRREGLEQARKQDDGKIRIVVGLAIVERECWVVSGFDPRDEVEESLLEDEKRNLGFDPRNRSHELTACKNDQAKRSPKRVLRKLSGGDYERECRCWRETSLMTLRERGQENGLAEYLSDVRAKLIDLIGYSAQRD